MLTSASTSVGSAPGGYFCYSYDFMYEQRFWIAGIKNISFRVRPGFELDSASLLPLWPKTIRCDHVLCSLQFLKITVGEWNQNVLFLSSCSFTKAKWIDPLVFSLSLKGVCNHIQTQKEMDGEGVADWDSYSNSSGKTLSLLFYIILVGLICIAVLLSFTCSSHSTVWLFSLPFESSGWYLLSLQNFLNKNSIKIRIHI